MELSQHMGQGGGGAASMAHFLSLWECQHPQGVRAVEAGQEAGRKEHRPEGALRGMDKALSRDRLLDGHIYWDLSSPLPL